MSKEVAEAVVATIKMPEGATQEKEMQQAVSAVEIAAKELIIESDDDYAAAAAFGQNIKTQAKLVADFFKPMKDSAYQAHKAVCDREKSMLKPLNEAERILKKNMTVYYQEKERKRLEMEEQMRREAEAEKERKLAEAATLEEEGKTEEAEAAFTDAQVIETVAASASVYLEAPKAKGVSNSKDWEIDSIDRNEVPISFAGMEIRPVDEKAIMRLIRASKGSIQIPGVKYRETVKVSIRR